SRPVPTSHRLRALSPLETMRAPSGENATAPTHFACCSKVRSSRPFAVSHRSALPSMLADRARDPSGEKATEWTHREPAKVCSSRPVVASQSLTVPSLLPASTRAPFIDSATDSTQLAFQLRNSESVSTSHSFTVFCWLSTVTARAPLGENPTETTVSGPSNVCSTRPVATSHSLAVLSALPERTRAPSGE